MNSACPCCKGTGNNSHYMTNNCHICSGTGELTLTAIIGDYTKFFFPGESHDPILLDEIEDSPEIAHAIWEWVLETEKSNDWWQVHAKYPLLENIEDILLSEDMLDSSEIPGGPNAPLTHRHLADAKAYQEKLHAVAEAAKKERSTVGTKRGTTYRDGVRNQLLNELKNEFNNTTKTESVREVPMSSTTVVEKLKGGGKQVLSAAKEGAAIGTVTAANKAAIDFVEYKMGPNFPDMFKTAHGRAALEMAVPALMLMALAFDEDNKIPGKEHVELAANLALKGSSSDAVQSVMETLITHGGVLLAAYNEAGQQLSESHQISEEVPDFTAMVNATTKVEEAMEVGGKQL